MIRICLGVAMTVAMMATGQTQLAQAATIGRVSCATVMASMSTRSDVQAERVACRKAAHAKGVCLSKAKRMSQRTHALRVKRNRALAQCRAMVTSTTANVPAPPSNAGAVAIGGPSAATIAAWNAKLLALTNADRAANGKTALADSPCLDAYALRWSQQQVLDQTMKHGAIQKYGLATCPDRNLAYQGENVGFVSGYGSNDPSMINTIEEAWMTSAGHRRAILDGDATIMGIGLAYDAASDSFYWTTEFYSIVQTSDNGGSGLTTNPNLPTCSATVTSNCTDPAWS